MALREWQLLAQVQDILDNITYKPGTRMIAEIRDYGFEINIGIEQQVLDVDTKQPTRVRNFTCISVPELLTYKGDVEKYVLRCVDQQLTRMELHEKNEWLRYKGVWVNDPHPMNREKPNDQK